jgi:hypothetical protein
MYITKIATCFLIIVGLSFISCQNQPKDLNQVNQLDQEGVKQFTEKLVRYVGDQPEGSSDESKFNAYFDEHYSKEVNKHELEKYHKTASGKAYFVFTRIAPSVKLKKVALGGYVVFNDKNEITELEEVFRTWKDEPDNLAPKIDLLFTKMVNSEDLTEYYTENAGGLDYIEFPNNEVWYNKSLRKWETSRVNPLEDFQKDKINQTNERIRVWQEANKNDSNSIIQ